MENFLLRKILSEGSNDMLGAFAETLKNEIASDEENNDSVCRQLIRAVLSNDAEGVCLALSGWTLNSLLKKARVIPDIDGTFYQGPMQAYVVAEDIYGNEWFTPCEVNMQTFEVFNIEHEKGDKHSDAEIIGEYICFDDMEDYRFPLNPKDSVFSGYCEEKTDCYDEDAEFDFSDVISYWYGENE